MTSEKAKKILVVDDEMDMRIFLDNLLRAEGYWPIQAKDTSHGMKKALKERPAVIILNMMMPEESGIQMYRKLKRNNHLRDVPVIMLTTIDKTTFLKCHNLHGYKHCEAYALIDQFMEKPFEAEQLLAAVTDLSTQNQG